MAGLASLQRSERVIETDSMDQRVRAIIAFMNTNLHRKLTPIEIAQSVRLSPSRLRHLFKAETGTSLARYQRDLRMEHAKELLRTTFLNVKEVAARVGIGGISHFVRDFEGKFGVTPARYAARYRKLHESANARESR